jgi:hypothetical protein
LDFGCGFGFSNPKSKLNQNIQKNKKPYLKPNPKSKKKQKPNSKSIMIFGFLVFKNYFFLASNSIKSNLFSRVFFQLSLMYFNPKTSYLSFCI